MAPPAAAIIEGRLYYCSVRHNQPPTGEGSHWFSIDDALVYWNFFLDFGPLNLGQLYRFCALLNQKLRAPELSERQAEPRCVLTSEHRTWAACLARLRSLRSEKAPGGKALG